MAGVAAAADEAATAQALFEKMAAATRTRSYDGVFVYNRGNHTDSMRIIHRVDDHGEQERLISLSGPAREVIRNNETVTCIYTDNRSVLVERSRPRKLLPIINQPTSEIAEYYRFVLLGRDRTADRQAWIIGIVPRTAFRYGYRFWIDAQNHLLLRSEVINSLGVALEQILFTQLSLSEHIPDDLLRPSIDGEAFTWYGKGATAAAVTGPAVAPENWKVRWVPEGFSLREHQVQRLSTSAEPVEHIVYSDGLAMISVFVEKLRGHTSPLKGFSRMGAVTAYSTTTNNDYQVTVVGEVPPLTVRQVASSVVYTSPP
ncbi:MAG: MucB/RseB C-terminal domain-containing protein [Chromatiales bacterium]